jgi:hypothetical protein
MCDCSLICGENAEKEQEEGEQGREKGGNADIIEIGWKRIYLKRVR